MTRHLRILTLSVLVAAAAPAAAQTPPPPPPPTTGQGVRVPPPAPTQPAPRPTAARSARPRLAHNRAILFGGVAFQPGSSTFTDRRTSTVNREPASFTADYDVKDGLGADGGLFLRVRGGLGVGVAVSSQSRDGRGTVAVTSPHPFFFDRPRTASLEVDGQDRSELGTHVSLAWMAPASRRLRVVVFAGPSFFSVSQTVIDTPAVADTYPYDAITLARGTSTDRSESMVGVHGGLDATWYFARRLGAGVLARFARGSTAVAVNGGESFDLEAGGAQISVGLRVAF